MIFGIEVAPRAGFEPATDRLTVDCSTTELPGTMMRERAVPIAKAFLICQAAISIKLQTRCALIRWRETPDDSHITPETRIERPKH